MSTRSRIGIMLKDKSVVSVYCHSDGYPTGVGKVLKEHYDTKEKVAMLLNLGDLSLLGTQPVACPDYWDDNSGMYLLARDMHFNTPFCRTYNTRGECTHASVCDNPLAYVTDCGEEFNYIFIDGQWFLASVEKGRVKYQPLADAIKEYE